MENTADLCHSFPSVIDNFVDMDSSIPFKGNDGIIRRKIELFGSINDDDGVFEYIIEPDCTCNHRFFRKFK